MMHLYGTLGFLKTQQETSVLQAFESPTTSHTLYNHGE